MLIKWMGAGLTALVAVTSLGATIASANQLGGTYTVSLTGQVANFNYFSFNGGTTHYDQGAVTLSGLGGGNAITVNQGDTIDVTLTLDHPFTVPASQRLTAHIINLTGPGFPTGGTASIGTMDFLLGGANVISSPSTFATTSGQVGDVAVFFPHLNGQLTFDTIIADFTINTLNGPATLDTATYYYTLFSSAAPEPTSWAMMILGVAGIGVALRRRESLPVVG